MAVDSGGARQPTMHAGLGWWKGGGCGMGLLGDNEPPREFLSHFVFSPPLFVPIHQLRDMCYFAGLLNDKTILLFISLNCEFSKLLQTCVFHY